MANNKTTILVIGGIALLLSIIPFVLAKKAKLEGDIMSTTFEAVS